MMTAVRSFRPSFARLALVAPMLVLACEVRPRARLPATPAPPVAVAPAVALDGGSDAEKAGYRAFTLQGFRVRVSHAVLAHPREASAVLARLDDRLGDARRRFGPAPMQVLDPVRIWVEWSSTDPRPRGPVEFHQSAAWLAANGYDVEKEHGVEISNAADFLRATAAEQPQALLHELAHAYDALALGNASPAVQAAYDAAVARGRYAAVARIGTSGNVRAYALGNAREYFAETTEAYLGMNDYFPFVREQLEGVDPQGYALMRQTWGEPTPRASAPLGPCSHGPSPAGGVPTALVIYNRGGRSVSIAWLDGPGSSRPMRRIEPRGFDVQPTFAGHRFVAMDGASGACLGEVAGGVDILRVEVR
jgi:hypothetical protein